MELPPAPSLNSGSRSVIASMNRAREHDDVLATTTRYDHECSASTASSARATPLLERTVVDVDENGVGIASSGGEQDRIAARPVVWAAGVTESGLAAQLAEIAGGDLERAGRIAVEPDLTLPGHPEVLALGDMVGVRDPHGEPHVLPAWHPSRCRRAVTPHGSSARACTASPSVRSTMSTRPILRRSDARARSPTCTSFA
jgi:hypothetical protein